MKNILQRDNQERDISQTEQYLNHCTENLFVVITYLIEAFKMRLLSIAESFESPKRSSLTFK